MQNLKLPTLNNYLRVQCYKTVASLLNKYNKLATEKTWIDLYNSNTKYIVYLHNTKVIGCVGILKFADCIFLKHLCVSKKYRHMGLGYLLLDTAIKKNKNLDIIRLHVRSDNNSCLSLINKLGFKYTSQINKQNYSVLMFKKERL